MIYSLIKLNSLLFMSVTCSLEFACLFSEVDVLKCNIYFSNLSISFFNRSIISVLICANLLCSSVSICKAPSSFSSWFILSFKFCSFYCIILIIAWDLSSLSFNSANFCFNRFLSSFKHLIYSFKWVSTYKFWDFKFSVMLKILAYCCFTVSHKSLRFSTNLIFYLLKF